MIDQDPLAAGERHLKARHGRSFLADEAGSRALAGSGEITRRQIFGTGARALLGGFWLLRLLIPSLLALRHRHSPLVGCSFVAPPRPAWAKSRSKSSRRSAIRASAPFLPRPPSSGRSAQESLELVSACLQPRPFRGNLRHQPTQLRGLPSRHPATAVELDRAAGHRWQLQGSGMAESWLSQATRCCEPPEV